MVDVGKSLLPDFVTKQGLTNPCLMRGADFEAYTGPMRADQNAAEGQYIVHMIGSSTTKDLQGDVMLLSALDDMTKIPNNLTILMNHLMDIPDSIFGGLYERPWIKSQSGIADFHLKAEVETANPKAMQTYSMIAKGRRLGCSIGCLVLDYVYDEDTETILVKSVLPVEYSIVSVPAQQRCWVEVAAKSLFERALMEGHADKALQLAPAVRGMYWRSYDSLVRNVENNALKNDLERVRPRDTADRRIVCAFDGGEIGFALADAKGIKKSLSREEVSGMLEQKHTEPALKQQATTQQDALEPKDLDTTKDASGKTSWPFMAIKTAWDGSKAEKQIFDWAHDADGGIIASKAKQCFLYYDPENKDKQSSYKMPFCFVDGSPKIVPLGVQAAADVLSGGMGGLKDVSDEDKAGMKGKVKALYGRINSQFKPDPAWVVPWEKDEKSLELGTQKDVLDSGSGAPLNRQELLEEEKMEEKGMPKASEAKVSDDGTHEACIGTHNHSHKSFGSQGDDEMHKHSHAHDSNADHGHSHAVDEKSIQPETQKAAEAEVAEAEQTVSETNHQKLALLDIYNSLGVELGLPTAALDTKSLAPINNQQVITLVSHLDGCLDQAMNAVSCIADASLASDQLMQLLGIPDVDRPLPVYDSFAPVFEKALANFFTSKDGREISDKNQRKLQVIHDCVKAMHPGCCESITVDEASDEARMQGEGQPLQAYPAQNSYDAIYDLTKSLTEVRKTFIEMNINDIAKKAVDNALIETQKSLDLLQRQQQVFMEKTLQDQQALLKNIKVLKEMPLGRPTQFTGRTTVTSEDTATYQDMLTAGINLSEMSEDDLEIVEVATGFGKMKMKRWPAGYKAGQRPLLTDHQKTFMSPYDYLPYADGSKDVLVPLIDETVRV